jgi:hypothetical protein
MVILLLCMYKYQMSNLMLLKCLSSYVVKPLENNEEKIQSLVCVRYTLIPLGKSFSYVSHLLQWQRL